MNIEMYDKEAITFDLIRVRCLVCVIHNVCHLLKFFYWHNVYHLITPFDQKKSHYSIKRCDFEPDGVMR